MKKKEKWKKADRSSMDIGSSGMHRRFKIVPVLTGPNQFSMKVTDGSEVDRMLLNDKITPNQHATLMLLMKRLQSYGFVGMKSPDYSSPIHADATAIGDKRAVSIKGAVRLFELMDEHIDIGKARRKRLVSLILEDVPWHDKSRGELDNVIYRLENIMQNRG